MSKRGWDWESRLTKPAEIEMLLVFYPDRPVKVNGSATYHVVEITLDGNVRCRHTPAYQANSIFFPHFVEVSDDDGATWYAPFAPKENQDA